MTKSAAADPRRPRRLSAAAEAVAAEADAMGVEPENLLHFRTARGRTLEQRSESS